MIKSNADIKDYCKQKKVYLYEVAENLGIQSTKLSVDLRKELPQKQKKEIINIIDNITLNRK